MGLFARKKDKPVWDGSRAESAAAGGRFAPGTGIAYDQNLVARFKGHHQVLLKLFGAISGAAADRNFEMLADCIRKFVRVLEQHVLEENLRFYIYLTKCLENDDDHKELVQDMKKEMSKISRDVRSFMRHHLEFGVDQGNVVKFQEELLKIGEVLVDRVNREEDSLYTLYLPPENY